MSVRQLEPACFKVLFHCAQLEAEDGEVKCQFLVFKEFLKVNSLSLVGSDPLNWNESPLNGVQLVFDLTS